MLLCKEVKEYAIDFDRQFLPPQYNSKVANICQECRKAIYCNRMPKFAAANGLHVVPIPKELSSLNYLELQLISLVRPLISMSNVTDKKGRKTQTRQKQGVVVFVPVPIKNTLNKVAEHLLPNDNNCYIKVKTKFRCENAQKTVEPSTIVDLSAVLLALHYLKENNAIYSSVEINHCFKFDSNKVCLIYKKINNKKLLIINIKKKYLIFFKVLLDQKLLDVSRKENLVAKLIDNKQQLSLDCSTKDYLLTPQNELAVQQAINTTQQQLGLPERQDKNLNNSNFECILTSSNAFDKNCQYSHTTQQKANRKQVEFKTPLKEFLLLPHAYKPLKFRRKNMDVKAFPHLFPDGRFGMDWPLRKFRLTEGAFIRSRLRHCDRRFARCMPYLCTSAAYIEQIQMSNLLGNLKNYFIN